jgi:hypothetical protein
MVHSFYSSAQPSGENTVVLNEVDALRRAGHEVALFAAHTDELEGEVFYKLRSGMRVATGYGRNPLKAINDFSPDVVHVHNLFPNLRSLTEDSSSGRMGSSDYKIIEPMQAGSSQHSIYREN